MSIAIWIVRALVCFVFPATALSGGGSELELALHDAGRAEEVRVSWTR